MHRRPHEFIQEPLAPGVLIKGNRRTVARPVLRRERTQFRVTAGEDHHAVRQVNHLPPLRERAALLNRPAQMRDDVVQRRGRPLLLQVEGVRLPRGFQHPRRDFRADGVCRLDFVNAGVRVVAIERLFVRLMQHDVFRRVQPGPIRLVDRGENALVVGVKRLAVALPQLCFGIFRPGTFPAVRPNDFIEGKGNRHRVTHELIIHPFRMPPVNRREIAISPPLESLGFAASRKLASHPHPHHTAAAAARTCRLRQLRIARQKRRQIFIRIEINRAQTARRLAEIDRDVRWLDAEQRAIGRRLGALERPLDIGDQRNLRAPFARHEEHVVAEQRRELIKRAGSVHTHLGGRLRLPHASFL